MTNIIAQQRAFFNTGATLSYQYRLARLQQLYVIIQQHEALIADALYQDLHKSHYESFETEIGTVLSEITYFKHHLRALMRPQRVKTPLSQFSAQSWIYPRPYGVILNISPWNYPFQLAISPLVGSIASGNCTVVKVSQYAPHIAQVIVQLLNDNFAHDYIYCVQGDHHMVQQLIKQRPDYLFFTGSPETGKKIMAQAASHLIPVTLELGGKSPCVVDETANLKLAAKRIVWGKFMNAGQTCIAPDYLLVHQSVKQPLLQQIYSEIVATYGKVPLQAANYPHIINARQYARLHQQLQATYQAGATLKSVGPLFDELHYVIAPTLITDATYDLPIMQTEIFGPILPVITYTDINDVVKQLQQRERPLALYLFSQDKHHIMNVMRQVTAGSSCINDVVSQFASDYLPFGGVGNSGMGRYHGKYSFMTMSHYQSILKKANWFDLPWKYLYRQNHAILKHVLK